MMNFWKEHLALRIILTVLSFAAGLALVIIGWKMTGQLLGLGLMLLGIVILLTALLVYNKAYSK